jgi:hypothetical protein
VKPSGKQQRPAPRRKNEGTKKPSPRSTAGEATAAMHGGGMSRRGRARTSGEARPCTTEEAAVAEHAGEGAAAALHDGRGRHRGHARRSGEGAGAAMYGRGGRGGRAQRGGRRHARRPPLPGGFRRFSRDAGGIDGRGQHLQPSGREGNIRGVVAIVEHRAEVSLH